VDRVRDGFVEVSPGYWIRLDAIHRVQEVTPESDASAYGRGHRSIVYTEGTNEYTGGGRYTDMTADLLRNLIAACLEGSRLHA
jgi:hypothetical protein